MNLRPLVGKILRQRRRRHYTPPAKDGDRYHIQGSWMYLDDKDSLKLSQYGIYEPEETTIIKKLVKKNHTVLDIGANIGYFTLIMAKQCKQVYGFEPEHRNFQTLKKNVKLNQLSNVKLYNLAVAETSGKATLHLCEGNRGMYRIYPSRWCNEGITEIETVRISDIIHHADFVKMDVEGAELGALRGMKDLFNNNDITLLMEFHPPSIEEYGSQPIAIYDLLKNLGYNIEVPSRGPVSFDELEKIAIENVGTNIICTRQ
jgi:FkbM family methyltransferase